MERTPFTSEVTDDDDQEVTPSKPHNAARVMHAWREARQRMMAETERGEEDDDDDEEEASPEKTTKRRIGEVLKGLFKKNVEKRPLEDDSAEPVGRSILGSVVALERPDAVSPAAEDIREKEGDDLELPQNDESAGPIRTELSVLDSEDDGEDDVVITTGAVRAAITPPVSTTRGGATPVGHASRPVPPSAHVPSGVGGLPPGGGSGGNIAPASPQTIIERQPVIEQHEHHHRKAALGALIIAERIDNHRNKKRKEQIAKVETAQNKRHEEAELRMSHLEQAARKRKLAEATRAGEKPIVASVERQPDAHTKKPEHPEVWRTEKPTPPAEMSRPQSIKEVLDKKPPLTEAQPIKAPSIADLERKAARAESYNDEDILVTAEKLAAKAESQQIAHEVYDERWHEVKDPAVAGTKTSSVLTDHQADDQAVALPQSPTVSTRSQSTVKAVNDVGGPTDNHKKAATSGLWAALVVGVIFAIILILT